ncbi:Putative peptidase S8/S53 domain, Fn3-like domain, peptidase S8, subtilisin, His-active [Colletotrichum destructivum]|uniref:Peptidase S8/S53 domain, Fn3-like domain, peptidase S8, subtilisin, His-active n=1 Tax=Colletotrichum destructivum TaxID=34406 RepID=A0AAX4IZW6_9PEZI|nr:Putative peptidase S8/S53 domain, Fn3-like domain, peptidase S8, subtilisin, His-active [Colletotrichum destructivum]
MCLIRRLAGAVAYCIVAVAYQTVPKAYFIELSKNFSLDGIAPSPDTFVQRATELSIPLRVRYKFLDQAVFYGLSVSLEHDGHVKMLRSLHGVENVIPVQQMTHPYRPSVGTSRASKRETPPDESDIKQLQPRSSLPRHSEIDWNSPHTMTGVDRLHAQGIFGDGVRISIIDTGIDYLHPALGGCFGKGCKVEFGYDFVGDEYGSRNFTPNPSADPRPGCYAGFHGTHVAGVAGMDAPPNSSRFAGLVGVAPRATLGMYRVFGCDGTTSHDAIVAAMQKSVEAGADVVSISICELGTWSGYPLSPLSAAVAALKAKGVAVIAAAGNSGTRGMFSIKLPAGADDALGIASVENSKFPTYRVQDSKGANFRYGSLYPFPKGAYSVVWADRDSGDYNFGCSASDYPPASQLSGPISNYIIAIKRGRSCSPTQIQSHAIAANYTRVITYPDPTINDVFVEGHAAPGPFLTADGSEFSMSSAVDDTLFNAAKRPGTYKLFVDSQEPYLVDQPGGGLPNMFSSIGQLRQPRFLRSQPGKVVMSDSSTGPNADFAFKPQLAAPGGTILSTLPLMEKSRGYGFVSGTSMATPYVSGVYALIKSQLPSLSVDEIFARMQTTAKQVRMADFDLTAPAIQQGAGLVHAYKALVSKSAISPGEFKLVDGYEAAFTIGNPSDDDVIYTFTNIPAAGAVAFPDSRSGSPEVDYIPQSFSANIQFTPGDRITVPAGSSLDVPFLVTPPFDIDPSQIPIFSGFIGIVSSSNETFTIPYMGPAYNYSNAPVVGLSNITRAQRSNALTPLRDPFSAPQVFSQGDKVDIGDYHSFSFQNSDYPVAYFTTLQPVKKFRFDIVRASTNFTPTWYGYDPHVRLDNLTETTMAENITVAGVSILGSISVQNGWLPHTNYQVSWSDSILDVRAARELGLKKGSYRVLLRWLKFFKDESDPGSWDSWMSGVIDVLEDVF